jgi:hypothetical protein
MINKLKNDLGRTQLSNKENNKLTTTSFVTKNILQIDSTKLKINYNNTSLKK